MYEWRTIHCNPLLQPPSVPTSSTVFHQHPLFSLAAGRAGGLEEKWGEGWKQGKGFSAYLWKCNTSALESSECGNRSYAGNVSLSSARAGPEKPTTLFKEMAVRSPSAALSTSLFLCLSLTLLQRRPPLPFFLSSTRMIIIFLCAGKVYFCTCWEEGEHATEVKGARTDARIFVGHILYL